jgi:DNA-binding NtrC family response regulator
VTQRAEPTPRSRPQLTWTDTSGSHAIDLEETKTVGSAAFCDLVVADKAVSRIHFELDPLTDGLWVRDLGSRNGTYVNGVRVVEARVPAGSTVRVGQTDITVAYGTPAPLVDEPKEPAAFGAMVAVSRSMRALFASAGSLAPSSTSILIQGEIGTGKKAFARAIHDASPRSGAPFVVVECAGLTAEAQLVETLDEALANAEGGTLVLDSADEMSLDVQRELVAALEQSTFRLIVTTTHDLRRLVNLGGFREDLYMRVAGAMLRVPPLRERTDDIGPLLSYLLKDQSALATQQLVTDLEHLAWMGNVRELVLYADRLRSGTPSQAVAIRKLTDSEHRRRAPRADDEGTMETPIFQPPVNAERPSADLGRMLPIALEPWFVVGFKEFRERWIELGEREYLRRLMHRTGRSSGAASRDAGLERTYLYRLIKKHGV